VGSQGMNVSIKTRNDYAYDPRYAFPSEGKKVTDIGDLALISPAQQNSGDITVKLGKNAIQIHVDFYTKPVNEAFLIALAKAAIARV
jgi:hypothetical protein